MCPKALHFTARGVNSERGRIGNPVVKTSRLQMMQVSSLTQPHPKKHEDYILKRMCSARDPFCVLSEGFSDTCFQTPMSRKPSVDLLPICCTVLLDCRAVLLVFWNAYGSLLAACRLGPSHTLAKDLRVGNPELGTKVAVVVCWSTVLPFRFGVLLCCCSASVLLMCCSFVGLLLVCCCFGAGLLLVCWWFAAVLLLVCCCCG